MLGRKNRMSNRNHQIVNLPRSQNKKSKPKVLSQSTEECDKNKSKSFYGTGSRSKAMTAQHSNHHVSLVFSLCCPFFSSSLPLTLFIPFTSQPWSGALDTLLRPFPPDVRYNFQRALGGFAEALGRMFPQHNPVRSMNEPTIC